jgi:hypothetical protein
MNGIKYLTNQVNRWYKIFYESSKWYKTKKLKLKNKGYNVDQIYQHLVITSIEATTWDIAIYWIELIDRKIEKCNRKKMESIKNYY